MLPLLKETLKLQDTCPVCGSNWTEIEKSLQEDITSENYALGLLIIFNCSVCKERFRK